MKALLACNHKLYGPGGAAELLAINGSTLKARMSKLGPGRNSHPEAPSVSIPYLFYHSLNFSHAAARVNNLSE